MVDYYYIETINIEQYLHRIFIAEKTLHNRILTYRKFKCRKVEYIEF